MTGPVDVRTALELAVEAAMPGSATADFGTTTADRVRAVVESRDSWKRVCALRTAELDGASEAARMNAEEAKRTRQAEQRAERLEEALRAERRRSARWKECAKGYRIAFEGGYARSKGSRQVMHLWTLQEGVQRALAPSAPEPAPRKPTEEQIKRAAELTRRLADPAPRYDEVYFAGVARMDAQARGEAFDPLTDEEPAPGVCPAASGGLKAAHVIPAGKTKCDRCEHDFAEPAPTPTTGPGLCGHSTLTGRFYVNCHEPAVVMVHGAPRCERHREPAPTERRCACDQLRADELADGDVAVELEGDAAFEWAEDEQTLVERLGHVATWLAEMSDLPPAEALAYAAVVDQAVKALGAGPVARLRLEANDVLFMSHPGPLSPEARRRLAESLQAALAGVRVVICEGGLAPAAVVSPARTEP